MDRRSELAHEACPDGEVPRVKTAGSGHYGMNAMLGSSGIRRAAVAAFVSISCTLGRGDVVLIAADLQSPVAVTQPDWTAFALDRNVTSPAVQALQPTAAGASVGISATLDGGTGWDARGLDAERAAVSGTSFNDVVSDLWFNRQMSLTLSLVGLAAGTQYELQAWHNDSYTVNEGAAAGGGTVTPSLSGGTVVSSVNGTITNLRGGQSDSAFGITSLVFAPTGSTATITLTRSGGNFTGVPLSGLELTTAAVPEPESLALGGAALAAAAVAWRRLRHRA